VWCGKGKKGCEFAFFPFALGALAFFHDHYSALSRCFSSFRTCEAHLCAKYVQIMKLCALNEQILQIFIKICTEHVCITYGMKLCSFAKYSKCNYMYSLCMQNETLHICRIQQIVLNLNISENLKHKLKLFSG
jgi:hypothetical protein